MPRGDATESGAGASRQAVVDAVRRAELHRAAAAFRAAVIGTHTAKTYGYFSYKASAFVFLHGDPAFMAAVLDEMDPSIRRVEYPRDSDGTVPPDDDTSALLYSTVYYSNGSVERKACVRAADLADGTALASAVRHLRAAARNDGVGFKVVTDRALGRLHTRFWNSLALLGWRNRARGIPAHKEMLALDQYFAANASGRVGPLTELHHLDAALVLGEVGRRVACGQLSVDLDVPLTRESVLVVRRGSDTASSSLPIEDWTQPPRPVKRLPVRKRFGPSDIPDERLDAATWAEVTACDLRDHDEYLRRRQAVELYLDGESEATIKERTGLRDRDCVTLIKRCARDRGDGAAVGWSGLAKYGAYRQYRRASDLPGANKAERSTAGWAGALSTVLARFSAPNDRTECEADLLQLITDLLLQKQEARQSKLSYRHIHSAFLTFLRQRVEEGVLEPDAYPFNTSDRGYQALKQFCKQIAQGNASRWVQVSAGASAASRFRLGTGAQPLFSPTAPFQVAALDFHTCDFNSIVSFELPNRTRIDASVPRWSLGGIVCMSSGVPLAQSTAFERQTTTEAVMELASVLVDPPPPDPQLAESFGVAPDGKWLITQMFEPLKHAGVDLLHLDRAWAHLARETLSSLWQTLGCAICFGGSRQWWIRSHVERVFAEVAGECHTLPSTTGSHPTDPTKKPRRNAITFRVDIERVDRMIRAKFRELVENAGEGSLYRSHAEVMRQLLSNKQSPWLPRPLPVARQADNPLSWITLNSKISMGTKHDPRAPQVRVGPIRFRGQTLARRADLADRDVVVQVKRMNSAEARAILNDGTGEILGPVMPNSRFKIDGLPWRYMRLVLRNRTSDGSAESSSPAVDFLQAGMSEIERRSAAGQCAGKAGLQMAGVADGMARLSDVMHEGKGKRDRDADQRQESILDLAALTLVKKRRSISGRGGW